jgi:hypothetical protein
VPDFGGVAESAAVLACWHKSLAAWLALHEFVNASHVNWVIILMFCAEPWLYDSVVHEREQTYHSRRMCFELRSVGSKAVSFLPSRPDANLISGVEQEPKSGLELPGAVSALDRVLPFPPTGCP